MKIPTAKELNDLNEKCVCAFNAVLPTAIGLSYDIIARSLEDQMAPNVKGYALHNPISLRVPPVEFLVNPDPSLICSHGLYSLAWERATQRCEDEFRALGYEVCRTDSYIKLFW